ncbi:DUF2281 domain-containing protein [Cylindrospermum sp. FACHB-282]|uniref:DUF2281 domain-containing protein n=1 Tax=Cylindrospermum sp. FACHB-282 TaxID=2692794 RepID=UPI0016885EB4|nr:DUF2281 domain-containing protein [Cylindrospermum sp. FACHB-282]MBD2384695.1 DUF2281 domain-containing protein [Cylindrospermum sp. FACHB-282]
MTNKELLVKEIESLPPELLTEALDFIRFIKASHLQRNSPAAPNLSADKLKGSKAKDLLEFAGSWSGDDIRECLQLVHDSRMPLQP